MMLTDLTVTVCLSNGLLGGSSVQLCCVSWRTDLLCWCGSGSIPHTRFVRCDQGFDRSVSDQSASGGYFDSRHVVYKRVKTRARARSLSRDVHLRSPRSIAYPWKKTKLYKFGYYNVIHHIYRKNGFYLQ